MPLIDDLDAGWNSYRGWRVNYDSVLLNLARLVEAPPAPWVSDRSPLLQREAWTLRRALILSPPGTTAARWRGRVGRR